MIDLINDYQLQNLGPDGKAKHKYGKQGTVWHLVTSSWWQQWKTVAQFSASPGQAHRRPASPGALNNRQLLRQSLSKQLLPDLLQGQHFEVRLSVMNTQQSSTSRGACTVSPHQVIPPTVGQALDLWYGGGKTYICWWSLS